MKTSRLTLIELFLLATLIPLMVAFVLHTSECVTYSAAVTGYDGLLRLSPAADKVAVAKGGRWELYEVETGELISFANCRVDQLQFSPDGQLLATGALFHKPQIWEVGSGNCLGEYGPPLPAMGHIVTTLFPPFLFSPDGSCLYVPTGDQTEVLNVADATTASVIETGFPAGGWNISPDGNFLCVDDGQCRVIDTRSGEQHGVVPGQFLTMGVFLPGSNVICHANDDKFQLWDVEKGLLLTRIARPSGSVTSELVISPSGDLLAVCCEEVIELWDLRTRRKRAEYPQVGGYTCETMRFTAGGQYLRVAGAEHDAHLTGKTDSHVATYNTTTGERKVSFFRFWGILNGFFLWLIAWVVTARRATKVQRRRVDILAYTAVAISVAYFIGGGLLVMPLLEPGVNLYNNNYLMWTMRGYGVLAFLAMVLGIIVMIIALSRRSLLVAVSVLILITSTATNVYYVWVLGGTFDSMMGRSFGGGFGM